jgi:molybdopterin-containing oxidoreductase family membrane subunit
LLGSFGLFFTLTLLFAKTLPVVSMAEVKAVTPNAQPHRNGHNGAAHQTGEKTA